MPANESGQHPELVEGSLPMEFVPLHFGDKLRIIDPHGRLGILTLWSKVDYIEGKLRDSGVDLDPQTSNIAAIGNLFGNGIPHLLRNLLYNPQIRDLIVCGTNRSGSYEELVAFFENGLEKATSLGEEVTRIKGTTRIIDDLVQPEMFDEQPRIVLVGEPTDKESQQKLYDLIHSFSTEDEAVGERIEVPLPEVKISHYPSEPRSWVVTADSPLGAWRELVFRLHRFGHLVHLRKGDRQELQNVKVVVTQPQVEDGAALAEYGFSLDDLLHYQEDMLLGPLPEDQSYTYGNRIREYYGFDALGKFAARLRENPQDRDCYLALWDSHSDIDADDAPCLVSLFFRVFDDRLTLTACYRTHNALDAWLKNVYGLMKAQEIVAKDVGIEVGALTVVSHSISIDPSNYDLAERVSNSKGFSVIMDPNGHFVVATDPETSEIVVEHHSYDGFLLKEYRSSKAERLQHEIARDCAISDINHAIYLGRQLAKAERCLKTGEPYEEG